MSEYYKETFTGSIKLNDYEYEECIFDKVIIKEEEIKNCIFSNCQFNNCEISNTNIINSKLTDSVFNKCKLVGVEWSKFVHKFGFSNKFIECYMPYSVFVEMDLKNCEYKNCNLTESFFEYDICKKVSFSNSDLKNTQFLKCDLSECDFIGSKNYFFDVRDNNVRKAKFSKDDAVYLLEVFGLKLN